MNFGMDDPLGDILSDGSNDSFFEEPKILAKRGSLTKTPDKKPVTDIFNLSEKKAESKSVAAKKNVDDWLGLDSNTNKEDHHQASVPETTKIKSPAKTQKFAKKISFDDDADDILGSMGFSSKNKPATAKADQESANPADKSSKMDLLESILGPKKTSDQIDKTPQKISNEDLRSISGANKMSSLTDILKESANTLRPKTAEVKSQSSQQSLNLDFSETTSQSTRLGEGGGRRGGRRHSGTIMDPLGLFGESSTNKADVVDQNVNVKSRFNSLQGSSLGQTGDLVNKSNRPVETRSTPNITDTAGLPDWLGGTPIKTSKSEAQITQKIAEQLDTKTTLQQQSVAQNNPKTESASDNQNFVSLGGRESNVIGTNPSLDNNQRRLDESQSFQSLMTQQKLVQSNLEYQNASVALQQQESQILMALQLRKYEERLSEMQMRQQEVLTSQEKQFNLLMERQFAKQQILENNMRLQQERINNHIQMLISQSPGPANQQQERMGDLKKTVDEDSVKSYENMINTLKQRQHEEMFLLEESYKKQISLLEQNLESVETRLKMDTQKLTEIFEEKLQNVLKIQTEETEKYKNKMQELEHQHFEEIKQIKENHIRTIDDIRFEYSTLVENLKQARQSETSLLSESTNYVQKLDSNINLLYNNSVELRQLKESVDKDYGILAKAREESIKAKEEEIVLMKATLEKCRESAEQDRSQLLSLVRSLETKIAEQNQNGREERWSLQQAASVLAARSAALDREAEFNRNSIEREREQLKTLKESLLAEQEKMILHLNEEKLAISAEKLRLETASKLNLSNYDAQKAQQEIEAAIQVAKEAQEMTDKERDSLHKKQCELEKLKRILLDQQKKLLAKESELENLMEEAQRKAQDGEKALFQSKTVENQYSERLRELKEQLSSLSVREKRLAEEKIALSKERLALHTMARQMKNKCSLCQDQQAAEKYEEIVDLKVGFVHPYLGRYENETDTDLGHFRLEEIDHEPPIHRSFLDMEPKVPI